MTTERTAETHGPAWLVQAASIARRFYLDGQSKVEIADQLGLSRFKVARILDEARELGLVEVSIRLPATIDAELSTALQQHLGVRRAIVLRAGQPDQLHADLGLLAAQVLTELVGLDDVLGLSCSRTVTAATHALTALAPCDVVQLTGTLVGSGGDSGSVESVRWAAAVGGGTAHPIYAPMVLPDVALARGLADEPSVRAALDRVPAVSVAMIAIGAWAEGLSTVWSVADAAERRAAKKGGVVGEISGRLFDADGSAVAGGIGDRVLGITLEQLAGLPEVIGLAHRAERAEAVLAAARGGLVSTLLCDEPLARRLLSLPAIE